MKKNSLLYALSLLVVCTQMTLSYGQSVKHVQPKLGAKKAEIIKKNGLEFKDLNKNGRLDSYEDWRLPVEKRINNLVSLMTLEEKVGLMFHPNFAVTADGKVKYDLSEAEKSALSKSNNDQYNGPVGPGGQKPAGGGMGIGQMRGVANAKSYIEDKNFRCILNNGNAAPKEFATWSNSMQEIAENSRLGIPIMFSTDPRHAARLGAHVNGKQYFSEWPNTEGQVGITASRDTAIVKKFGEVVAKEYRAVGLHMILGPQIDLMTEPRWERNMGAFSEDANLTADMLSAFMDGAQGEDVGPDKILVHLKHWPGAGPEKGGAGLFIVYPGKNMDYQLIPWKRGIAKGALAVMGYYSGTYIDTLNVCFSPYFANEVLRKKLGFKGAFCTDWGVVSGIGPLNPKLKGKTTLKDNIALVINAGTDQMGSQTENELLIELVKEGRVSENRINEAAKRILEWQFKLGLFENPYVDPEAAVRIVKSDENQKNGYHAQLESVVLLTNSGVLPAQPQIKLYIEGVNKTIATNYAQIVDDPANANLILVRTNTTNDSGGMASLLAMAKNMPAFAGITDQQKLMGAVIKSMSTGVSPDGKPFTLGDIMAAPREINIDFPQEKWDKIKELAKIGVPVVVAINPTGSNVVLPVDLKDVVKGLIITFDITDNALLDVVFGKFNPIGKLPFEIPGSMEAVKNQKEDVPFDSGNPSFKFGDGLSYK